MISKELVGTSERLEQIKNKLSSSAACSVLHVSNLDRCLEEFDEITKKLQGRFLYFYSQNGNAQLFVLLVDFHRAMRLGCSSYIDAQFALLRPARNRKSAQSEMIFTGSVTWRCQALMQILFS